ncbi:hypothetical protein [Acinetobacter variabilis]|uniref:hypothetical protein n=1 Tax=Acinetobacter variabilis TaxID=70346 RepID=UPI0028A03FC7|nr:hypothetical protein [Acinetobacter variabilis]
MIYERGLLFYLNRFYTNYDKIKSQKILREKLLYREKDNELEADKIFIFSLPALKREVYLNCHVNWDSGITLNIMKGNEDLIWFLRFCWLSLVRFFPQDHFSAEGHIDYIDKLITDRANYHYSRLDCSDQLKSGSISKITLGYSIAKDIDQLIIELVEQLLPFEDSRKEKWFQDWNTV